MCGLVNDMTTQIRFALYGIIAAILFGSGFFTAYKLGEKDRQALADLNATYVAASKLADEKAKELEQDNKRLSSALALAAAQAERDKEELSKAWKAESSRNEAKIKDLKSQLDLRSKTISQLRDQIASETDEAKRKLLEEHLAKEQAKIDAETTRVSGLECLAVPIPIEYIDLLNSFAKDPE